jgi:alcohol dehydrogenase YqhD (iron-dependent ADH family)
MSLDSFVFQNPVRILYGKDSIEKLGAVIKEGKITKVLLLFGSGSVKTNGVYDRVLKTLKDNGIKSVELWGVQPNPVITKVREGIAITKKKENGIEAVVAVGGGSVLDSGKAICVGTYYGGDVYELYEKDKSIPEHLPLYTVLTLSATGSEFNKGSVISDPSKKLKLGTFFYTPVASAIDPTVQFSLPWRQVMCGAVDSLSHLMESYFSKPNESITGREVNLAIQRSVIKSMKIIRKDPKNYNARASFCWAVSIAINGLQAIGMSGDWNVHWIEHAISAYDDKIAHGEGLAVVSLQYYPYLYKAKPEIKDQFEQWAEALFNTKDVNEAFRKFRELYIEWEAPLTLNAIKIPKEGIEEIVKIEDSFRNLGRKSPVLPLTKEIVRIVLTSAISNYELLMAGKICNSFNEEMKMKQRVARLEFVPRVNFIFFFLINFYFKGVKCVL